jgi:hypothetical protein
LSQNSFCFPDTLVYGVNPKYLISHVALQQFRTSLMYLVVIAWLYVALMMAVAEATSPVGTIIGAFFTFVLYGAGPVALVVYVMDTPRRKKVIKAREAAEMEQRPAAGSSQPDAGGETAADAVAPVRKKS